EDSDTEDSEVDRRRKEKKKKENKKKKEKVEDDSDSDDSEVERRKLKKKEMKKGKSWMVDLHDTSEPEIPISRVVRTPISHLKSSRKVKIEPEVNTQSENAKIIHQLRKKFEDKDCVDITDQLTPPSRLKFSSPTLGQPKSSTPISPVSDPEENARNAALSNGLNKLKIFLGKKDHGLRKDRNLAPSQLSAFVGSSAVKLIIVGANASQYLYDLFEAVDPQKAKRLLNFHMTSAMNMFRQRSLRNPSPYRRNGRVAFLDPMFTAQWHVEYNRNYLRFPKSWVFDKGFIDLANGVSPNFAVTEKKWFKDVDLLYICHNIDDEHWVAVEVDITKKKLNVYDCIRTLYGENKLRSETRVYAKMILILLHRMFPNDWKSEQAFSFYRMKNIPQNIQTGDCGIYTLKLIECLALGHVMGDLNDANIGRIRKKYAAEIMDGIPTSWFGETVQQSDPNPHGQYNDWVLFQTSSMK
ncbi:hypothetical protein EUTSA_v10002270mg, partial [Eutrema salsugineum]